MTAYDFIVVGAGSAGCALAARLAADPRVRVLLVEAGGRDGHPMLRIPLAAGKSIREGRFGWGYSAEPSPGLAGRAQVWPRGKVLGGTSAINGMVYIRGNAADYDEWAALGNDGWSYADILPLFKRSEGHADRHDAYHGTSGKLRVTRAADSNPLYEAFIDAGAEAGFPRNDDFNGESQEGFGRYDFTIHGGRRSSAAALLAGSGPNLELRLNAEVTRLRLKGARIQGVEIAGAGGIESIDAAETILCAGAIGSPVLMMRSGIGDPRSLAQAGVAPVHALSGVGRNLQDHVAASVRVACTAPLTMFSHIRADRISLAMLQALVLRTGPATRFPCEGGAFTRLGSTSGPPDVQWHFFTAMNHHRIRWPFATSADPLEGEGFSLGFYIVRPESRGRVMLRSADPKAPPIIESGAFSEPADLERMCQALEQVRDVASRPALRRFSGAELSPGPAIASRAQLREWLMQNAGTVYHPVGTCRMGIDDDAVVTPDLRVRGLEGLRVADASIMPLITRGNTNAPSIAIGEKAADLARGRAGFAVARTAA